MREGSTISYDTDGPATVVTIERPAARNAVNHPTAQALAAAFRRCDGDASSSVAILTGRGGAYRGKPSRYEASDSTDSIGRCNLPWSKNSEMADQRGILIGMRRKSLRYPPCA